MRASRSLLSLACLLALPTTLARAEPAPEARLISLKSNGTLRETLQKIAQQGELNLVLIGDLDDDEVEVAFSGVTAAEALDSLAKSYKLSIEKSGRIWTVREADATEPPGPPEPPEPPALPDPAHPAELPIHIDHEQIQRRVNEQLERAQERMKRIQKLERRGTVEKERSIVGSGRQVIESGSVVDDVVSYGGGVLVESGAVVNGDVVALFGGDVQLEEGAVVNGDAVAIGGKVIREDGAVINGSVVELASTGVASEFALAVSKALHRRGADTSRSDPPSDSAPAEEPERGAPGFFSALARWLMWFAGLFALGFVLTVFAPSRMNHLQAEVRLEPVRSWLVGMLSLVALGPLTVAMVITIVGIPLIPALWALAALALGMGVTALAAQLGRALPMFGTRKTQALVLGVGLAVLLAVGSIPYLRWLALFAILPVALGAAVRTRLGQRAQGFPESDLSGQNPAPVG